MTALAYRLAAEPDLGFVFDSWIVGYRDAHAAGMIAYEDWDVVMRAAITRVLARPGVSVHVACHPGETDRQSDLYGWIAAERGGPWHETMYAPSYFSLVHYVYVKKPYRRMGLGKGLLDAAEVDSRFLYTCKTGALSRKDRKTGTRVADSSVMRDARWDPLIARTTKQ